MHRPIFITFVIALVSVTSTAAATVAECKSGTHEIDEATYFVQHGRFCSDPIGPRISETEDFLNSEQDIAVEIYAGRDISSAEELARDIEVGFMKAQNTAFPVRVQVQIISSPSAPRTHVATFFKNGSYGWKSPYEYLKRIPEIYKQVENQ